MGYVPGFEHDVFISYAIKDNLKADEEEPGWVDVFQKFLEKEINRTLIESTSVDVWRDVDRIKYGEKFPDSIAKGIGSSAVLIVLLSKQYLASEWCKTERHSFLKAIQQDARRLGGHLFVASLGNPAGLIPAGQKLPDGMSEIHHASFWREVNKRSELLGHPVPDHKRSEHQDFFTEVYKVAEAIAQKLDEMRSARKPLPDQAGEVRRPDPHVVEAPALPSGSGVYIAAETVGSVECGFTKALQEALTSSVPPIPTILLDELPGDSEISVLHDTLKASKLFVQTVGYVPPRRDGLQHRLATELKLPSLVWKQGEIVEKRIDNISDQHRQLIAQARMGTLAEAVRAVTELWEKVNQPPPPAPVNQGSGRRVFINHLPEDLELGERVFKLLTERQKLHCVKRPLDGESEAVLRAYFERELLKCSEMVLVYGKASRLSANDQAELCYQMLVSQKNLRERAAQWIVVSGPPQLPEWKAELDVGLPYVGMRTVDGRTDLEAALAAAFQSPENGGQA